MFPSENSKNRGGGRVKKGIGKESSVYLHVASQTCALLFPFHPLPLLPSIALSIVVASERFLSFRRICYAIIFMDVSARCKREDRITRLHETRVIRKSREVSLIIEVFGEEIAFSAKRLE